MVHKLQSTSICVYVTICPYVCSVKTYTQLVNTSNMYICVGWHVTCVDWMCDMCGLACECGLACDMRGLACDMCGLACNIAFVGNWVSSECCDVTGKKNH